MSSRTNTRDIRELANAHNAAVGAKQQHDAQPPWEHGSLAAWLHAPVDPAMDGSPPPGTDGPMHPAMHPSTRPGTEPPVLCTLSTRYRKDQREWVRIYGVTHAGYTQEAMVQLALDLLRDRLEPGWRPSPPLTPL